MSTEKEIIFIKRAIREILFETDEKYRDDERATENLIQLIVNRLVELKIKNEYWGWGNWMKITKEILRDYKDFRIGSNNKFMREFLDGRIDYAECPFCETGNGCVEYEEGFLVCRICNHWWTKRKPGISKSEKRKAFLVGMIIGEVTILILTLILCSLGKWMTWLDSETEKMIREGRDMMATGNTGTILNQRQEKTPSKIVLWFILGLLFIGSILGFAVGLSIAILLGVCKT